MSKRNIYGIVGLVLLIMMVVVVGVRRGTQIQEKRMNSGEFSAGLGAAAPSIGAAMDRGGVAVTAQNLAKVSPAMSEEGDEAYSESTQRLVIKTGEISVVVKNVRASAEAIAAYAKSHGGYIVSSNISQDGIAPSATVTIRIPVAVFDAGFAELKAIGDVQSENVTGEDVTDQYVDLNARLHNLQVTESQLQEIMRRATKISDVLEVQEQLTAVRGNIESLQGRIKYLKDSASMSSLTVYLSTDPSQLPVVHEPTDTWKPIAVAKEALRSLLDIAKSFGSLLIWVVIFIPLWALGTAVVWAIVKLVKRVLNKRNPTL